MQALSTTAPPLRLWRTPPRAIAVRSARSVDVLLLERVLAGELHGRVHSVFDRVINFVAEDDQLYTLACSGFDDAPHTAVLDLPSMGPPTCVDVDEPVHARGARLFVGDWLAVAFESALRWFPDVACYPRVDATLRANVRHLRVLLARHGARGGMVADPGRRDRYANEMTAQLQRRAQALCDALLRDDSGGAAVQARSMIGLGPGLTPSGDDFLVGLLAVLNVTRGPGAAWLAPLAAVAIDGKDTTNAISHAALIQAAHGRVRESIATLIGVLMRGAPATLASALHPVIGIGSTSGTDIATGILAAFEVRLHVASWA